MFLELTIRVSFSSDGIDCAQKNIFQRWEDTAFELKYI
jgi:hypothetical protein